MISYIEPPYKIMTLEDIRPMVAKLEKAARNGPLARVFSAIEDYYLENEDAKNPPTVKTGTLDYYETRAAQHAAFFEDFCAAELPAILEKSGIAAAPRSGEPPEYLLRFGAANIKSFAALGPDKGKFESLSTSGTLWRNNTLKALQESIELLATHWPDLFVYASLFDQNAFNAFCMETHLAAYEKSGVNYLPFWDALIISTTALKGGLLENTQGISLSLRVAFRDATNAPLHSLSHFFDGMFDGNSRRFNEKVMDPILRQPQNTGVPDKSVRDYMAAVYIQSEWPKPRPTPPKKGF